MPKALLASGAVTTPRGTGVGSSTASRADHPDALAGSAQMAELTPQASSAPTVPPKFTAPLVAVTKSVIALAPLSASVGKVRSHHLKPVIALPLASLPLGVAVSM